MPKSHWKLFLNTTNIDKANKLLNRAIKEMKADIQNTAIEECHKGGFTAQFQNQHVDMSWNDLVVETIEFGQRIGYSWIITGNILFDCNGWSNETKIPGVVAVNWIVTRAFPV